ncbi:unnamed protein product, partial [Polarella glacialis]
PGRAGWRWPWSEEGRGSWLVQQRQQHGEGGGRPRRALAAELSRAVSEPSLGAARQMQLLRVVRALAALGREFAVLHMEVLASLAARSDLDVQVRVAAAKCLGAAFTVSGGKGAAAATICRVLVQDAEERVREAMVEALGFFLESMPVHNSNTNNTNNNNNSPEEARAQCAAEAAAAEASVVATLVSCLRSDASWTVREAA